MPHFQPWFEGPHRLHLLLILALALGQGCVAVDGASPAARAELVDGTRTAGDPAVVALTMRRRGCAEQPRPFCTGTLIAPRVVLTAAHCVERHLGTTDMEVFFGGSFEEGGDRVVAMEVGVHPDYDRDTEHADLALVLLAEPAPHPPVTLPDWTVADLESGAPLRVVGFGDTSSSTEDSGIKREGTMTLGDVRAAEFEATPNPSVTCTGDSGGPVFATLDGAEGLVGVTSSGDLACRASALNSRVDVGTSFIAEFVEDARTAPLGWASDAIALEDIDARECLADVDCPAALTCSDDTRRCGHPGVGEGVVGRACSADTDCGEGEECTRFWPTGPDACHCFTSSGPAVPPPPSDDSGCTVLAPGATDGCPWVAIVWLFVARLGRRRG